MGNTSILEKSHHPSQGEEKIDHQRIVPCPNSSPGWST